MRLEPLQHDIASQKSQVLAPSVVSPLKTLLRDIAIAYRMVHKTLFLSSDPFLRCDIAIAIEAISLSQAIINRRTMEISLYRKSSQLLLFRHSPLYRIIAILS